jgi:hypothetical protein
MEHSNLLWKGGLENSKRIVVMAGPASSRWADSERLVIEWGDAGRHTLPKPGGGAAGAAARARSHCRFVLPLIHFMPDSRAYSLPLFLKRRCDRTLAADWRTVEGTRDSDGDGWHAEWRKAEECPQDWCGRAAIPDRPSIWPPLHAWVSHGLSHLPPRPAPLDRYAVLGVDPGATAKVRPPLALRRVRVRCVWSFLDLPPTKD